VNGRVLNKACDCERCSGMCRQTSESPLRLHLRALYTDPKGLNLRDRIAHGLANRDILDRGTANWGIHSLMTIRTYAHQNS
jgi:hypothetical protein